MDAMPFEVGKPSAPASLLRVLGKVFALSVAIGTTIGGGILYTPGKIAALLPNTWLYMAVWVFGGINALLGATVFAELAAMIPRSGGPYPFARRALGDYSGFLVGYTQWVAECAGNAGLLLLIGEYAYVLVPPFAGHAVPIAFATLIVLTGLNWRSVREGGRIQVVTTVAKTLALSAVVGAAFLIPHPPLASAASSSITPHGIALVAPLMLAMPGVIFSYDSYYYPIFFGEELRDPGREIPRAIFRGLAVIIAMYVLLNAAFLWVLPIERMANEPFVGGAVANVLFGLHGDPIIRIIVMISVLGTSNGIVLGTARGLLAMARDGVFAHQATRVNAGGTPTVALLLSTVATAAFLVSGTFGAVLGVFALLLGVNLLLMSISLVVLRRREPDTPRPYRAWGYPWTTWAAIFIGVVFIVGIALSDQRNGMIALAIVLASYPVYRGTRRLFRSALDHCP